MECLFNISDYTELPLVPNTRGGCRAAATSKMERFVIIVNGWKPLTIITKRSILGVAAVLDPPLNTFDQRIPIMRPMVLFPGVLSKHCDYYLIKNY